MCWLWLDLGNEEMDAGLQIQAMGRALDRYGANEGFREDFPGKMIARMMRVQHSFEARGTGDVQGVRQWVGEGVAWVKRHEAAIRAELEEKR